MDKHGVHYVGYWLRIPCSSVKSTEEKEPKNTPSTRSMSKASHSRSNSSVIQDYYEVRHGQGNCYWPDLANYSGEWRFDKPDGKGIFKDSFGSIYDGFWYKGMRQGYGVYSTLAMNDQEGYRYEGDWHKNMRHGWGSERTDDDLWYEGEFFNDQKSGKGT